MAIVRCRYCQKETEGSLTTCQHCGEPLRPSGLMAFLKPRAGEAPAATPAPTERSSEPPPAPPPAAEPSFKPEPPKETPRPVTRPLGSDDLPHSAVIYFHAEDFFAVRPSGERSIIARLFGSALELHSVCSAMLFSAYAALVENGLAKMQVAAVIPTGSLVFPIPAQWIKLIFETLSLPPQQPSSLEGMLMARAKGRLSSTATQRLLADLMEWTNASAPITAKPPTTPLANWNRHYAEALTAVVRQKFPAGRSSSRTTVERTEKMLNHFYQQHKQVGTYLSHEVNLIMHWVASQQDAQLQQRQRLLAPHGTDLLKITPAKLYDEEYWRTLAQYARRQT